MSESKPLLENEDYYIENGNYVFTAKYLRDRGFCCENNCRHCPYDRTKDGNPLKTKDSKAD